MRETIRVHISPRSGNSKTGPIPVTTTTKATCPDSCPLKASGCYAKGGPLAMHWQAVTDGKRGGGWADLLSFVAALPEGQLWRHNQAGDLPGEGDSLDVAMLAELADANRGRRGFTYTHKPLATEAERQAVKAANDAGLTINLSANGPAHADQLAAQGIAPVVTILPEDAPEVTTTPAGRRVVVCPAQTRDNVSCATCGLCARADRRGVIVGFRAHGSAKRRAEAVAIAS